MQLTVDIGNSRVKTALFDEEDIISSHISDLSPEKAISNVFLENTNISAVIISSVRETFNTGLIQVPKSVFKVILTHKTSLPIINKYESPETLGNDRLALAVGATVQYPFTNCLIIDSGTCLTMDVIDEKNQFLGGTISPGIQLRLKSMHHGTKNLPYIEFDHRVPDQIGKDTQNCMKSGAVNGLINEVLGTISSLNEQFNGLQILLTGGDAKIFDNELKSGIFADPNLVLRGLNKILLYNLAQP